MKLFRKIVPPRVSVRDHRQFGTVIDTYRDPFIDWIWGGLGTLAVIGVFVMAANLDDPEGDAIADSAAYAQGIAEGRRQEREAHLQTLRAAYQHGLDEAYQRCADVPSRQVARQ